MNTKKLTLLLAVWALALTAAALTAAGPAGTPETLAAYGRRP